MTERPAPFGRVITAMVSPFNEDGSVDLDGAAVLADHLAANGSDGLVVTGSTGEISTLTDDERVAFWRAVKAATTVPVLAGATSNDTAHSVELVRRATAVGVDGILAVTPYYNRPAQAGIAAHFRAIAEATDLPVILYDIPVRTGRQIAPDTICRLASEVPNIVGLKDALGNPVASGRLMARLPEEFVSYSGDDAATLPLLALGAVGLISVASHWCGVEFAAMIRRFLAGDVEGALEIHRAISASCDFESSEDAPNPVPVKAVLRALGLPAGQCRLPLGPAPDGLDQAAKALLAELDTWRSARGDLG